MNDVRALELKADQVPLDSIASAASEIIEMVGGTVESETFDGIRFTLPSRRGSSAGGSVACLLSWSGEDGGTVRLTGERDIPPPKARQVLLLGMGVLGALFWLLWPFFPDLGAAAWVGGAVAIAAYFVSLRASPVGAAAELLERIVSRQRSGDYSEQA